MGFLDLKNVPGYFKRKKMYRDTIKAFFFKFAIPEQSAPGYSKKEIIFKRYCLEYYVSFEKSNFLSGYRDVYRDMGKSKRTKLWKGNSFQFFEY